MKKLFLIALAILLSSCSGTSGNSTNSTNGSTSTVNCAANSICPPTQINVVSPKTN